MKSSRGTIHPLLSTGVLFVGRLDREEALVSFVPYMAYRPPLQRQRLVPLLPV